MKSDWHNFKYILTPSSQVEVNVIKNLAKHYPIVTFGGKNIDGCKNMGYISDEELVKLYSAAFVLLFPQIHEPFGYIPVESMACGTPVIAYDEQGPKETIVNEKTGWLVADEQEFMKKVEEVWQGYEIGIRQFCRKHILSKYSTEIFFYSLVQTIHYDDDNC
jgi:glycosyltransferase involved in cell wall biosynthesis